MLPHLDRIACGTGVGTFRAKTARESGSSRNDFAFGLRVCGPGASSCRAPRKPKAIRLTASRAISRLSAAAHLPRFPTTTMTIFRRTSAPRRASIRLRPAAIAARLRGTIVSCRRPLMGRRPLTDHQRLWTAARMDRRPPMGRVRRRSSTATDGGYAPPPPHTAAARSAMASRSRTAPHRSRPSLIRSRAIAAAQQPYPQQQPQYGAAPNQADVKAPMQLGPGRRAPPRDVTGTVRPNTVATLAARGSARDRQVRASAPVQAPARDVPVGRAGRHDRDRYGEHASLSRARQRAGDALRHRRRPRGLHLGRRRARLARWPSGRTGIRRRK